MSKFTEENPFEFEGGVKVWRDENGVADWHFPGFTNLSTIAPALHAFIEAERSGWHWTNDEHTEARNGRWGAKRPNGDAWCITHEDFPRAGFWKPWSRPGEVLDQKMQEFLAWKNAQNRVVRAHIQINAQPFADALEAAAKAIRETLRNSESKGSAS